MHKKFLIPVAAITTVLSLIFGATAANAVVSILNGTLTVTVPGTSTPITLTDNSPSPAMTLTSIGIGLSGRGSGNALLTRIEIHPSTGTSWAAGGWSAKNTCPTTPTTTLADCGLLGVYINGVAVSNLQVSQVASSNGFVPGMLQISSTTGNTMVNTLDMNGTVRVELASGTWNLAAGASLARGWVVQALSASTVQGNAYATTNTVTFVGNGAAEADYYQTQTIGANAALTANQFTRSGYSFGGWAISQSDANAGTVTYTAGQTLTFSSSPTLYAIWIANPVSAPSSGSNTTASSLANTGWAHAPLAALSGLFFVFAGLSLYLSSVSRRAKRM